MTTGRIVVEPALGPALAEFRSPLAFLDFETVSRAIPRWGGCRECLVDLAAAVPALAPELERIADKLVDLYPVVRNHVYHPDFNGSFSIKQVLPALVPALSYGDLAIDDGMLASVELQRLMFAGDGMRPEERARLRDALLRYCERDSWAIVKLLERLRGLTRAEQLELF